MAWALLAFYAFTFLMLLIFSIACWRKYSYGELAGYWKFFLHMWCKLQLVSFFMCLAVYQPCCVKAFLKQLYKISVSWDHRLRVWINSSLDHSVDFRDGINRRLNDGMTEVHVRPYVLHNMLIFFMVQLLIALIYIIFKIWDFMNFYKKSFMFKIFNFIEYTLLILGYVLVIN